MSIDIVKITKIIRDKNGNLLVINPDGSINIVPILSTKCKILQSDDVNKAFTWAEIDGVRRVVRIDFTSAKVNAELSATIILRRDFTYQAADPFDLVSVADELLVS